MKALLAKPRCLFWLALALIALGLAGCATNEADNTEARPWNAPQGWDSGLPSQMMEGR